jgi:hypothetical protein
MIAIVVNMNRKSITLIQLVTFFQNLSMFSIGFVAGAVGAGAASWFGSGSTKMMQLLAAPAPQHCPKVSIPLHSIKQPKKHL